MAIKILVVDDEPDFQDVINQKFRTQIQAQEMELVFAENGARALEKLRGNREIDLLLTDLNMPVMNGLALLNEVLNSHPHLRSIVISAYGDMSNIRAAMNRGAFDFLTKPVDLDDLEITIKKTVQAVRQLQESARLQKEKSELEKRNQFIRATFGRYVSDEIVEILLASPEALRLGGEKREITVMMSDLRGFTSLSERLVPEQVIALLNRYFEAMIDIILQYGGTINEFIGDAMLVIFGAPIKRADDAQRAVACALAMQLAMPALNQKNKDDGLPAIEMGIGLSTGEAVAGNIGSLKRSKYGIVGRYVNLASRIESYTIGHQILVSEETLAAAGPAVHVSEEIKMEAKGFKSPVALYEVRGIAGEYNLFLPETSSALIALARALPVHCTVLDGKHAGAMSFTANFVSLSQRGGEMQTMHPLPLPASIKMRLSDMNGKEIPSDIYGKVLARSRGSRADYHVHFTAVPPEAEAFLRQL